MNKKNNILNIIPDDSNNIFVIPYANRYVVYAPLRKAAFIANAASVNFLNRIKYGATEFFTDNEKAFIEFLDRLDILGEKKDMPLITYGNKFFKPTHVTLFLTTRCNLNCIYCYAMDGTKKHINMNFSIAKMGIDLACCNALESKKNNFNVNFHGGGEPTTNWKIFTESLSYARTIAQKNGLKVYSNAASNGVYSNEQCQWIINNLQGVNLSMDGLPEIHDFHRPLKNGDSSSQIVLKTIEAFEKAQFPYNIRSTVTSYSVKSLSKGIEWLLNRFRPKRIMVEPVYNLGRGQNKAFHVEPEQFIEAFREAGKIADEFDVPLLYSAARIDVLTNRFCGACGDSFCLTPSGKISSCYEIFEDDVEFSSEFVFGNCDINSDSLMFDHKKLQNLRNRKVEDIQWCKECFCKWHCAGDCLNLVRHAMVKNEFMGHPRCEITQALILDQILLKIRNSGGIFWKGDRHATTNIDF
ncbi:MAG: radical SAM protein [Desulfobacterales bacterium]|nr:radical SAM protein [Desulfobacterales bacterium]